MEKRITCIAAVVVVAFSAAAAANDEVAASFQRMLDHVPAAMPAVARSDADPLQVVNEQLRASRAAEAAAIGRAFVAYSQDPVPAGFERMLSHPATAMTQAVPDGFAADPLVAAVAEPLREVASGHDLPARFAALKVSARR